MSRRLVLIALVALFSGACGSQRQEAEEARAEGRFAAAAEAYGLAAVESSCPERSRLLLERAEMQDAEGTHESANETIEKAIMACNGFPDAVWVRAQRRLSEGDRAGAREDAASVANSIPAAATLRDEIDKLHAVHERARSSDAEKLDTLIASLDVDAKDAKLDRHDAAQFERRPPIPMTVKYAVRQTAYSPDSFELTWTEEISNRGEPAAKTYFLVRRLEVPELDTNLPWPVRLTMSNQRQPMRFEIDQQGHVIAAQWHQDGPERGMRPEMLRPEIEGGLQRKRLYDPGETGSRAVGESWAGEDVRVLDGRAVTLPFQAKFVTWESVRGVECAKVETTMTGPGTKVAETVWLHPESSVAVQWSRTLEFEVTDPEGTPRKWSEAGQGVLIEVTGHR